VFLTFGGLHGFYDGFIWKLRRPAVARGFSIDTAPTPVDGGPVAVPAAAAGG
jgi:hypothetical protein